MGERRRQTASTEGMKAAGYYDAHSEYQRRVIDAGDKLISSMVEALDLQSIGSALVIADYGAGTGATSVHAVKQAIAALRRRDRNLPVLAVHNDVPTSDFTQLFRNVTGSGGYLELPEGSIYPAAVAGSFFGQVLPSRMVHAGMCSNAAHWLREQPRARIPDGMYFCEASGRARQALAAQAARDWLAFLEARAEELADGGRLLVQGIGTVESEDEELRVSAARLMRVMWQVASGLVDDGLLDPETLERYVFPVYCRSPAEAKAPVRRDGPMAGVLDVVSWEVDEVANPYWEDFLRDRDNEAYGRAYEQFVRAFAETTLLTHLFRPGALRGDPEALSNEFFERFRAVSTADPEAGRYEAWIVRIQFARTP